MTKAFDNKDLLNDLPKTSAGDGASRIGIADAGNKFNGTTVEAALQETATLAGLSASGGAAMVGVNDGASGAMFGTVQGFVDGSILPIADYAALRAYAGPATRVYVTGTLGTVKPSGIAGVFQYDATDTTSADNGGTIIVGAGGKRWKRDFSGAVSVTWFGADKQGIIDSTAQIQAAINAAKRVYVPTGVYLATSGISIPSQTEIFGDGPTLSEIKYAPSANGGSLFVISGNDFIEFKRLYFSGPGVTGFSEVGVDMATTSNDRQIVIDQCRFRYFDKAGLFLGAQWHVTLRNSEFYNNGKGVEITFAGMPSSLGGSGNVFQDCYFGSNGFGIYNSGGWNVNYLNCTFESNETPIYIDSSANFNVINSCWLEGNTNPPSISNSVLVIGGRGWSMDGHNVTTANRGSFVFNNTGFASYKNSTPIVDWSPQYGFKRFESVLGTTGFTPVYNATSGVNEGVEIRTGVSEAGTFSLFTRGVATSATAADNKGLSFQGYSGYFGSTLNVLYDSKQPLIDVYFEFARNASGSGQARGNFCVATGVSDGTARTSYAKRFNIDHVGHITPGTDNAQNLGSTALRWSTIYAGTGTINTSDGRLKQQVSALTDAERLVAKSIKGMIKSFKFNDSVDAKGDKARIHFGVIAQDVHLAFEAAGLDAASYALFCNDVWHTYNGNVVEVDADGKYVTVDYLIDGAEVKPDEDGKYPDGAVRIETKHDTERHDRMGIRYDQLLAFIIAAL